MVGVDGTGRYTMSKCSAFLLGYKLFEIVVNKNYMDVNWKEDLKNAIKIAGCKCHKTVFLIKES